MRRSRGNNGGATTQGVTASTIKVVYYVPQATDPILNYIESAIKDTATNAQNIQTMQDWVTFYNHFFETYGRKVVARPLHGRRVSRTTRSPHGPTR